MYNMFIMHQLHLAIKNKNDEFYTDYKTACMLISPYINDLKDKRIICPCDTPNSNIYKVLKDYGFNVSCSSKYELVDYSKYDIVITNPPFSKMKDFMCNYVKDTPYLLISNFLIITYKWFATKYIKKCNFSRSKAIRFVNSPKLVMCRFITTLPDRFYDNLDIKIENGKVYKSGIINKCKRKDYAYIEQMENGKKQFFRLVYGKSTQWILDHVPNLIRVRYNLADEKENSTNQKEK